MRKRRSYGRLRGFRSALPGAAIYVYDNNSGDRTVELRERLGWRSQRANAGKGNVVRRMSPTSMRRVIMADGDLTYDPAAAPGGQIAV